MCYHEPQLSTDTRESLIGLTERLNQLERSLERSLSSTGFSGMLSDTKSSTGSSDKTRRRYGQMTQHASLCYASSI